MKRYCQTLKLVDDPELIRKYCEVHAHVWPEIIEGQRAVGILDMQIYCKDTDLFMICDTVDDFDWDRDWERLSKMPRQAEWEAFVAKAQGADPSLPSTGKWQLMDKIFAHPRVTRGRAKVFVSGCYDLLHSGHIEFFKQASQYGDLYVGIGSDETIEEYKHHKPMFPQEERLFMVSAVKYVKEAVINEGRGVIDFLPSLERIQPDIFVVNAEGGSDIKRKICEEKGIEYVELQRTPAEGLQARSSSALKKEMGAETESTEKYGIPTRLDLAGTWIDQPYVSVHHPGWAVTISLEPTFEVRDRCGLSTSTRKMIQKIWPVKLPKMDPETLARLVFCFENNPEREDGIISGAQDAIGICVPGLCRHYYDNHFWPDRIETCSDEMTLRFLEEHIVMIPMEPRKPGCSVVEGRDITRVKVKALADAADACWNAILRHDLSAFAAAYRASFEAQTAMFPGMLHPTCIGHGEEDCGYIVETIDRYSREDGVLAWKMPGAGGGGYLALVVDDAARWEKAHPEAIRITVRR